MENNSTESIIAALIVNTTNGNEANHFLQVRSTMEIVMCVIVLSLIIATAVLGNSAVILAVTREHELQEQVSNLFILNLSITDLSSAIFIMFSSLLFIAFDWKTVHPIWCNLTCAGNYELIIVSMLTMCFISVDRYQAVIHPLQYKNRITKRTIQVMIIYSWCQGLVFALVPVGLNWNHYDYWEGICAIDWHYQKEQAVYYVIFAFLLCFAFPGLGMTFCYMRIALAARKCVKPAIPEIGHITQDVSTLNKQNNSNKKKKKASSSTKVIKSLLLVVAIFFICMTPFCVTKLLKVVSPDRNVVPPYANLSASFIGYLSSVVNPLIYAIFRPDFRKAYKKQLLQFSCFEYLRSSEEHTIQTTGESTYRINTSVI